MYIEHWNFNLPHKTLKLNNAMGAFVIHIWEKLFGKTESVLMHLDWYVNVI